LTKGTGPDAPARLSAQKRGNGVQLNWLDISGQESGYVIEYSLEGENSFTEIAKVPANSTSHFFSGTSLPAEGVFRIFAYRDGAPPSPFSNEAKVIDRDAYLSETLVGVRKNVQRRNSKVSQHLRGILAEGIDNDFLVFPNPARHSITVRISSSFVKGRLSLCNSKGVILHDQWIFPQQKSETILSIESHRQEGLLWIKFKGDDILLTEKLMSF